MADGFGLREKLDARIASARRSLLWPALIRAILPALVWFTAFIGVNLFQSAFTGFCPAGMVMRKLGIGRDAASTCSR